MRNYWSCTKFADWLRGTAKPESASGKGWNEWRKTASSAHKFRYWLAEEGLDAIQDFVMWPIDKLYNIKYWLVNRFNTKTHSLTSSTLERGQWHDLDSRILFCLFDELVNFVEIEKAWIHIVFSDKADRKKYNMPWYGSGWFNLRSWRCPQAGLDHLDWESTLIWDESSGCGPDHELYNKPTYQANNAQEIAELYHWWKFVRPVRPDPYDESGWSEICDRRRENGNLLWSGEDESPEEEKESKKSLDLLRKIEEEYETEDTDMLIRLIKIRKSLWT